MKKKHRIDFTLYENDYSKIIFRFRPDISNCHSFGDIPPTKWEEVYKVYYYYEVFQKYSEDKERRVLWRSGCDECSIIGEVACRIPLILEGKKKVEVEYANAKFTINLFSEIMPCGDGVFWKIDKLNKDGYHFSIWNSDEIGYRFYLDKDKMQKFGEYLKECCEYMLAHGDPI